MNISAVYQQFVFDFRGRLIDCHQPTGPNRTHTEMFAWVKEYFMRDDDFKPPVYLQHHGKLTFITSIVLLLTFALYPFFT